MVEDPVADDLLDVDVAGRAHLAGDDDEPGRQQGLDGDAAVGVLAEHLVEDRVADLVGDLVGVPLGDGFGGEEASGHVSVAPACIGVFRVKRPGHDSGHSPRNGPLVGAWAFGGQSGRAASRRRGSSRPATSSHRAWASAVLEPDGTSRRLPSRTEDHGLVVVGAEDRSAAHVVDDEQVAALAGELGAAEVEHRAGRRRRSRRRSRPRPGRAAPGRGTARRGCRGSGSSSSAGAEPSPVFLILVSVDATGRKSAGAAAITTASAEPAADTTASRSSSVVSTRTTLTPAGSGSDTLAATRVTSAPRATAARARATPCRPDDRLPRKRTGSSGSRVPPADTTTVRPARSRRRGRGPGRPGRTRRSRPARAAGPCRCRRRSAGRRPARSPARRAAAASRRWPGWRRAPTSRCAWPGRRRPGSGR